MDLIETTHGILHLDEICEKIASPDCGALSAFVGLTRNHHQGRSVVRLEYECYVPMALKEMKKLCAEIRDRWKVANIAMVHRLGVVPVSEASVVIAVTSEHRKEALQATEYAIDTLKARVPIWKKEVYGDSDYAWKENKECGWHSGQQL